MDQALPSTSLRAISAVRSGTIIGLLGFLTVLPFYIWIHNLQAKDKSAAALAMSSMHMENMHKFWSFPFLQATGIAGLIWAYFGVTLGLFESGKTVSWLPLSRAQTDRLHRVSSLSDAGGPRLGRARHVSGCLCNSLGRTSQAAQISDSEISRNASGISGEQAVAA